MAQNWIMIISELRRYQGVCYKSDITVISGLDLGDRQVLEQRYAGCDPPCLLDSSDGRFVLKGPIYNPLDVMNCLMGRRGYRVQSEPQQRTIPNTQNKDDKFCLIYHLSKDCPLRRANTTPAGLGQLGTSLTGSLTTRVTSAPPKLSQFFLLISGGKMNNTRLLARSMEYGCSMSTISYVSMMLITANTVANLITNINVNSNDDNNNKSGNVKVEDFKNILSIPALLYILKLLH